MNNVMIDLETLGTFPGCVIMSLGAVEFDVNGLGRRCYFEIFRPSCELAGLETDVDTVAWWDSQPAPLNDLLRRVNQRTESQDLQTVLAAFTTWLPAEPVIWGKGAAFDNAILAEAYRRVGHRAPWHHRNDLCFRTLETVFKKVVTIQPDAHLQAHNALDDAIYQAEVASQIFRYLRDDIGITL